MLSTATPFVRLAPDLLIPYGQLVDWTIEL
jgi:hypothetical protein